MSAPHDPLTVGAWLSAAVAAVSLANAALTVTIIAGMISVILGLFRLHDRLKYGPVRGRE